MAPTVKFQIVLTALLTFLSLKADQCNNTKSLWSEFGKMAGAVFDRCLRLGSESPSENFTEVLQRCLKRRSFLALERSLGPDVIEIASGVQLVRVVRGNDSATARRLDTALWADDDVADGRGMIDWTSGVLRRIAHVFDTHVLKIRLNGNEQEMEPKARRRRRHMMMSLIMFGIVAVGMIMIPMGFQFLAVLGGKALLLAKMALLLTSIQGLKKIATSHINYGLYSTGVPGYWNYDRQWPYDLDNHDGGGAPYKYYDAASEQQSDLLHPLGPRIDSFINKYRAQ